MRICCNIFVSYYLLYGELTVSSAPMMPLLRQVLNFVKPSSSPDDIVLDLSEINADLLTQLLIRLPFRDIVCCRQICDRWRKLIDSRSFWLRKEEYENNGRSLRIALEMYPNELSTLKYDAVVATQPFACNLLRLGNPEHREPLKRHADSRTVFRGGGNGFRYQSPPSFLEGHFHPYFEPLFDGCFETSFHTCTKTVEIDLKSYGLSVEFLDNAKPAITYTEYVCNRSDSASHFSMFLAIFDENNVELTRTNFVQDFEQWQLQLWIKVSATLRDYPTGGRKLLLSASGRDSQFWAGFYGPKIAGSQLTIDLQDVSPTADQQNHDSVN